MGPLPRFTVEEPMWPACPSYFIPQSGIYVVSLARIGMSYCFDRKCFDWGLSLILSQGQVTQGEAVVDRGQCRGMID